MKKAKIDNNDLLDLKQAVTLLKTTRPTFYRWLRAGKFKGMKVGRQWRFYKEDLERYLKGQEPRIDLPADISPLFETLAKQIESLTGGPPANPASNPIVRAVNYLLLLAIELRASDIHLAANFSEMGHKNTASLRFRIDGLLHEKAAFDVRLLQPVIDRLKVMSECDLNEKSKPQDGRIILDVKGRQIDLRVSFLPSALGESVTIRLLDPSEGATFLTLDRFGMSESDLSRLRRWLSAPWGMTIVSGPTGSGKTSTLYAGLQSVAGPSVKTITIEDPVEYLLPWMTQVQVNPSAGLDFATAMRAMLRSDPDVVMVGEIRDRETSRLAQQAALTGHLVLTSMNAGTAAKALMRLTEVGGDALMSGEAVKFVLAQRLVRLLCTECSVKVEPDQARVDRALEIARKGGIRMEAIISSLRGPKGCPRCGQTGYRGRTIVTEGLEVTTEIAQALARNANEAEIEAIAVGQGMTTLAADGIRRAATGETSLDEVFRVMGLHEVQ